MPWNAITLALFAGFFILAGGNLARHLYRKDWESHSDMVVDVLWAAAPVLGVVGVLAHPVIDLSLPGDAVQRLPNAA
jgi:hypothetical protein